MPHFNYTNVNDAFEDQVNRFNIFDQTGRSIERMTRRDSRDGAVIRYSEPVTMTYERPLERVLFSPARDANPFFHLYEAVWMLAGRNDLASLTPFVKQFKRFSDDGETLHGAYGYRWRKYFGYDQLDWIAEELKANPDSRRCVLQMWDGGRTVETDSEGTWGTAPQALKGSGDLYAALHGGKDVPCNLSALFEIDHQVIHRGTMYETVEPRLNMTVMNRSNDLIWGALGANYVHFSLLQEYLAGAIGVKVGVYNQVSNNLHVYTGSDRTKLSTLAQPFVSRYSSLKLVPLLMENELKTDLTRDIDEGAHAPAQPESRYATNWFRYVFNPAMEAHAFHKIGKTLRAAGWANAIVDDAWRVACTEWLERRYRGSNS